MGFDWAAASASIIGALIGGGMTGYYTLKSADKNYENQQRQSQENEEKIIKGLLQAIHDETETVQERYAASMGAEIEALQEGQPFLRFYPLISDYFSVYNGNTFLIGRVPDNDLRKQIIKTYTLGKGIVDSIRFNNELLQKYEYWHQLHEETKNEAHRNKAVAVYNALIDYAKKLKLGHNEMKAESSILLRMLRKHGVLAEK